MTSSALPATPHASQEDPTTVEQRLFENRYLIMGVIGEGGFGRVYQAHDTQTGAPVALKEMIHENPEELGVPAELMREISFLKQLRHKNVVRLHDVFYQPGASILVLELMAQDLKEYMEAQPRGLTPAYVKNFQHQLCAGIMCCHSNRVMHRDLKPQNLLVNAELCLKIADFGLARTFAMRPTNYTPDVVTAWYRAPELILGSTTYTFAVDRWSIGCILAEMATGAPPFEADSIVDVLFTIFRRKGTPTESTWPGVSQLPRFMKTFPEPPMGWASVRGLSAQIGDEGIDLLERFTRYVPSSRTSAKEALAHDYLAKDARFTI